MPEQPRRSSTQPQRSSSQVLPSSQQPLRSSLPQALPSPPLQLPASAVLPVAASWERPFLPEPIRPASDCGNDAHHRGLYGLQTADHFLCGLQICGCLPGAGDAFPGSFPPRLPHAQVPLSLLPSHLPLPPAAWTSFSGPCSSRRTCSVRRFSPPQSAAEDPLCLPPSEPPLPLFLRPLLPPHPALSVLP